MATSDRTRELAIVLCTCGHDRELHGEEMPYECYEEVGDGELCECDGFTYPRLAARAHAGGEKVSDATRGLLDKKANEFINARWVNKDGRTTGEDMVYGLSFNALHSHLVQFALENAAALAAPTPEKERGKP